VQVNEDDWEAQQAVRGAIRPTFAASTTATRSSLSDLDALVFEDQIDFVSAEGESSKRKRKKNRQAELSPLEPAVPAVPTVRSMEEVRRSLPIFAYRDDLLAAIRNHQILIVVGETGSGKVWLFLQFCFCSLVACAPSSNLCIFHSIADNTNSPILARSGVQRARQNRMYTTPSCGRNEVWLDFSRERG